MRIKDERELLPYVRDRYHTIGDGRSPSHPLRVMFEDFLQSNLEHDEYRGWTFNLDFVKATSSSFHEFLQQETNRASLTNDWYIIQTTEREDIVLLFRDEGLIRIHLFSYLWTYPCADDYEPDEDVE